MLFEELHTVLGVEIKFLSDGKYSCRYALLQKKGNAITLDKHKVVEGNLKTILESLPKNYPVALTITGKGIVNKSLAVQENHTVEEIFAAAFPAIEKKDFFIQAFREAGFAWISLLRKTQLEPLLETLKQAGLKIQVVSLGAAVVLQLVDQLEIEQQLLAFDGHFIQFGQDKSLAGYRYQVIEGIQKIKIGGKQIPEAILIAYAAAFQLMLHDRLALIQADVMQITADFHVFVEHAKLKKKAGIVLFALFASLLLSFILFSYYNGENAKLMEKVGHLSSSADQLAQQQDNIAGNLALLKQLNWNGGYNYGFLLNEIGKTRPRQLWLTEIAMNDYKTDQEKSERKPSIKIAGETDNLTAVNNWIFILKEREWVKSVKLSKYQEDPQTGVYIFNLLIEY
ncbi:hypothetical protein [Pedobacter rhizosphaerae]|uniref:Fimbrial assembly protein (PilN) n=1 Tax=Pedobacter rhizosphaerae TaxID=390241 RepID=A0A1H9VGR1_9SPHI|nr:hypothetical protein [Pedobacter rhizosphaerae]SES20417.1 Fimbrial assembly protein (PilN) [Pedobacter rhizosphaerae]